MQPAEALLRYPLTRLLGPAFVAEWLASGEVRPMQVGQTLILAGTPGESAWLVLQGRVRVLRPSASGREVPLGVFGAGHLFGEYALLPPHQNTATCRACESGRVARLPLAGLRARVAEALGDAPALKNWLRLHALLGYLREGAFLGFLSAQSVLPMLDRGCDVSFNAGHTIQAEGLGADRWFFVRRGEVVVEDENGSARVLRAGDCFGESGLRGDERPRTAAALADTVCWCLSRAQFLRSVRGGSKFSLLQTSQQLPAARRPYEWLAQRGPNDCGVSALAMAARHHLAGDIPLERLAALVPLEERGASLRALAGAAERLGLRATAVRIGPLQLGDVRLPAVAHLSDGHFVTLFELRPAGALVGDPTDGIRTVALDQFCRTWSGHLLLLAPA